jgi:diguanylate cyclase (GGDEF)-like protein/PAS domain S-box-containing protein
LRESEERYRWVVENLEVVVFQTDADGQFTFINPAWTELTGFSVAESLSKSFMDFLRTEDRPYCLDLFRSLIEHRKDFRTEARFCTKAGGSRWVEAFARPAINSEGAVVGSLGTLNDITDRKAVDEQIQRLAYHDALTSLPNRTLLMDRLDRALIEAKRQNKYVAVLFLDLDNFKTFNDTLGHDAGDQLLREVSHRLTRLVRQEDTIARVGGDEFLLLMSNIRGAQDAALVASKTIQAFELPFCLQGRELRLTLSIGISIYPDNGASGVVLLKNADIALYEAKDSGRNKFRFFNAASAAESI